MPLTLNIFFLSFPCLHLPKMNITTILSPLLLSVFSFIKIICSTQALQSDPAFHGAWQFLQGSIGIFAMHMQCLNDNKVIMFDRTDSGPSNLSLPYGRCRLDPSDTVLPNDCTAHSVLYDIHTNTFRPLMLHTDTWCSSGSLLPDGSFFQSGGFNDGERAVRKFTPCLDDSCDWVEYPNHLSQRRWYASNLLLPDGRVIIVGGRRQFNYEFYPINFNDPSSSPSPSPSPLPSNFLLQFLADTTDESENNLYPFLHLLPNGKLFLFANSRSILLDYIQNRVVKEYPPIPGNDPRNYPSSGSSVLLPLDENEGDIVEAEIMICGGAPRGSFILAGQGTFIAALSTCGRLRVSDETQNWVMEEMPMPRVMGDMVLLPTGDILIVNGAGLGTAGWELSRAPVLTPVIYRLSERRFVVMSPASKPRLYHSTAILLIDGRVLVGGSNPHESYNFTGVEFPTDLSLEAFSPPYLSGEHEMVRPRLIVDRNDQVILRYRMLFSVMFTVPDRYMSAGVVSVRIMVPSFSTHSSNMNQRMVVLKSIGVTHVDPNTYSAHVLGPSTPEIAPAGYYMLFVVHAGIPSTGMWVKLQ